MFGGKRLVGRAGFSLGEHVPARRTKAWGAVSGSPTAPRRVTTLEAFKMDVSLRGAGRVEAWEGRRRVETMPTSYASDPSPRWRRIAAGLSGSLALTAVHEGVRRFRPDAPRMDVLASRAIVKLIGGPASKRPSDRALYVTTLVGDLVSNGLYFAALLAGPRRGVFRRSLLGGLLAGGGALVLAPRLGLGHPPHAEQTSNRVMTVAWYTLGALTAASVFATLDRHFAR